MQLLTSLKKYYTPLAESLCSSYKAMVDYFLSKLKAGDIFYLLRLSAHSTFLRVLTVLVSLLFLSWHKSRTHLTQYSPASSTKPDESASSGHQKSFTFLRKVFGVFCYMCNAKQCKESVSIMNKICCKFQFAIIVKFSSICCLII